MRTLSYYRYRSHAHVSKISEIRIKNHDYDDNDNFVRTLSLNNIHEFNISPHGDALFKKIKNEAECLYHTFINWSNFFC
jgi:hypothetical protein